MKLQVLKYRRLYFNLFLSISFAMVLVFMRVKFTNSTYYLFLVWNLFLAGVPFLITQTYKLTLQWQKSKILALMTFAVWLLFLPNSPYIITDLVHLHDSFSYMVWYDMFLVFVFALNGLILGLLSLMDMSTMIRERYGKTAASYTIFKACLLSGFGIYLGRFLRFNSWDVATKPKVLLLEILQSLREPKVWMITFAFGGFLWILFLLLNSVNEMRKYEVRG